MQDSRAVRRARAAATVAFATNGALPMTLLARYAEVKELLGVDAGAFGLLVAGLMIGAAAAFQLPGALLRRWGSGRATSFGTAWMALTLALAAAGAAAGNPWWFVIGLVLAGFGDAFVDVAQNSQGLRVQNTYGRSLLSSMHAGWSIGAATGGLVGTIAASAGIPLPLHLGVWGLVCTIAMASAARSFLPDRATGGAGADGAANGSGEAGLAGADAAGADAAGASADPAAADAPSPGALGRRAMWMLAPLALVALAGIAVEDVGNNWSAVLLSTERGMPAATAGIGLSVLLGTQFVGRLAGDRFIDRVGNRRALVYSLALIVLGLVTAAWAPWAALTVAGLAVAGLGCAITVPLAFAGADALPGLQAHAGVTWVNWIMRVATIALTPAIGGLTVLASLPVAITAVSAIALVALLAQARRRA